MATSASPHDQIQSGSTKVPIPTTTTTTTTMQAQTNPQLPPSHLFDILPPLHALLSRLEPSLNTYSATNSTPASNAADSTAPLTYKEAATASQFLKARIRRALVEVDKLGDMERTVDEQEVEIKALEARIARQRDVVIGLGEMAGQMRGNAMEGVDKEEEGS